MTPDHQRRVEELKANFNDAVKHELHADPWKTWYNTDSVRHLIERLARAEAERNSACSDRNEAQAKLLRLRAQPLDEGLRERLHSFLVLVAASTSTPRYMKDEADSLLRDLRTPPASPPSCTICDDPSHDAGHHWEPPRCGHCHSESHTTAGHSFGFDPPQPPPPTLTDRERIGRLEKVFQHIDQTKDRLRGACASCYYYGPSHSEDCPIGAIARELASCSGK